MAKLIIFVATLTAFLLLVDASIHSTTVIIDENNPRRSEEDCRDELIGAQDLKYCQEYIMQEASSRDGLDINRREEERLDRCCEQLRQMRSTCRCYGLRKAVMSAPKQRGVGRMDFDDAASVARSLPGECGMEPDSCQFGSPYRM
ncbi:PREDICTED: 2S sulfur-rich seed storage protein 2-like [Populus euphratica]|uniref:2S sulfur-rich seed storage protein 2-like n=1 Tax=Populus euphratica TaxID=75702 RepID=A0AAJ6TS56_POPEU|nr:PREDICTED: 2S sulfur-rich seed storage protein 2-like [Populus euphratica]